MASQERGLPSTSWGGGCSESLAAEGSEARWFFKSSELRRSLPTIRKGGFDAERELKYRQRAAGFIQDMGERLNHNVKDSRARISQLCLSAAMVHMHRFYVYHPFQIFDYRDMGATALFLAGKMEDCPRKLEHIVIVWHKLKYQDQPPLVPQQGGAMSEKFHQSAQLITTLENILLQTIAFDLEIKIPHTLILSRPQTLQSAKAVDKDIIEAAYWFASDILHMTTFCIRYRPTALAVICFHLSSSWAAGEREAETPKGEDGKPWYFRLDPEVTPDLADALAYEFVAIRRAAESEGRTKLLRSTEFFKKRNQQAKEAEERQANQSGQSPLPPPPAPPPNLALAPPPPPPSSSAAPPPSASASMRRTKTEPVSLLSLDRYREKRAQPEKDAPDSAAPTPAVAAAQPSPAQPPRKSFMPDMNASADTSFIGDLTKDSLMGNLGVKKEVKSKSEGKAESKEDKLHRKDSHQHRHRTSSSSAHKQGDRSREREQKRQREREEPGGDRQSPSVKRPRPEGGKGASSTHYPPHYREGASSSANRAAHRRPDQTEASKDRNGNGSRSQRPDKAAPSKAPAELLPPPPPAPPIFSVGGGSRGRSGTDLASIPVPPPQPGDSDFEEGEIGDEEAVPPPLPSSAPPLPSTAPPLPPAAPPPPPPPPP